MLTLQLSPASPAMSMLRCLLRGQACHILLLSSLLSSLQPAASLRNPPKSQWQGCRDNDSRGFNTTNNRRAEMLLSKEGEQTGIIDIDHCCCRHC
jgi:hypothetical protein